MLEARDLERLAVEAKLGDRRPLLAPADHGKAKAAGVGWVEGGEQLVVLAACPERLVSELLDSRLEREPLQLDDQPAARADRHPGGIERDPVREVDQRMGAERERTPLRQPKRRPKVAANERVEAGEASLERREARSRSTERPGDDEEIAGAGAASTGHTPAGSDGGDRENGLAG